MNNIKIAFFDAKPYDKSGFVSFSSAYGIEIKFFEARLNADTVNLANGYDGVCIFVNDNADKFVIDRLCEYGVRLIALRCAGYNNVDVEYTKEKGLSLVHVPAYSPYAVAEHAMALLLTSVRRIHKAYIRTRDFNFSLNNFDGFDLHGKTVGVVGTGRIGKAFIDICRGFGMKILCYDKYVRDVDNAAYTSLDEIFAASDIISLHCPLTEETVHLIDDDAVDKMKKGVVIINTSRGGLIDTDALIEGIKARKIGAACLDVYEEESNVFFRDYSAHIVDDDKLARLISMPNVIVTSHQAFLTKEALSNIAETTCKNIREFFSGEACRNELCFNGGVVNCSECK